MYTIKQAATVVAVVTVIQIIALKFSLYYVWPELDIPMHFLGGFSMGLVAMAWWAKDIASITFTPSAWLSNATFQWCVVIGFVATIGIGWEWFEFALDHIQIVNSLIGPSQTSVADTMGDLSLDLGGGVAAYVLTKICYRHITKPEHLS